MTGRSTSEQIEATAVDSARAALASVGITVATPRGDDPETDALLNAMVDDRPFRIAVEAVAYATGGRVAELIDRVPSGRARDVFPLLVADRITADARERLSDAGWSWLDRRGRLHLRGPAVRVDLEVPPETRSSETAGLPVRGRAGLSVAYWLCAHPGRSLSPTKDRAKLRLAPSTVSTTVRRLAEAGLVDDDGAALLPELFWELAGAWRPERTWLVRAPDPEHWRNSDPDAPTWRRSGTAAAVAYDAPIVTTDSSLLDLYVPGPVALSIAKRRYGSADPGTSTAVLAVAPVAEVCIDEPDGLNLDGWTAAPRLAVALDLAQDRARGREILDGWKAGDGVWR